MKTFTTQLNWKKESQINKTAIKRNTKERESTAKILSFLSGDAISPEACQYEPYISSVLSSFLFDKLGLMVASEVAFYLNEDGKTKRLMVADIFIPELNFILELKKNYKSGSLGTRTFTSISKQLLNIRKTQKGKTVSIIGLSITGRVKFTHNIIGLFEALEILLFKKNPLDKRINTVKKYKDLILKMDNKYDFLTEPSCPVSHIN